MDEEQQFKRAIELSLQESQPQSQSHSRSQAPNENQHEGDEEDEEAQFQRDLAAAIEASKSEAEAKARSGSKPARGQRKANSTFSDTLQQSEFVKDDNVSTSTPNINTTRSGNSAHEEEGNEEIGLGRPAFLRERAKMEKERLDRIEKTKAQGSIKRRREEGDSEDIVIGTGSSIAGASGFGSGAGGTNNQAMSPPTKRQRSSPAPPIILTTSTTNGSVTSAAKNNKDKDPVRSAGSSGKLEAKKYDDEVFWDGELRQIANRLVDRDKDTGPTFRLSEIIGPKSEITLAILSSYSNNMDWLYTFFDPTTPIIVVNQPGDGNSGLKQLAPNLLMTKPFIRNGRGCMHTKLFYKDERLRIVVPTANFVEYDWRDIENTAWVQDVPLRRTTIRHDPKATDFPGTLQRVLHTLNVPAALTKLLDDECFELPIEALSELRMRWDWSKVRVKLVASIAGRHEGWEQVSKTGHPALMKAVQELDARLPKGKQLVLECQGSSVGTYSTQWMNEFYDSARGESARIWLDRPKSHRAKLPWPPVKILFPSLQTVKDSVLGMPGGGTMFCRKAQWESKNFPRELFYDSNSKRGRVLMHSKMIIGYFKDKSSSSAFVGRQAGATGDGVDLSSGEEDNNADGNDASVSKEKVIGWAYIGSHNFTPSAWGTLSGSESNPSLNIVNYELGIVLPLRSFEELEKVACWKRPARQYVKGVDRPWMQDEMREGMAVMPD
ncbi:hypothetical protein ACEPAI_2029 [Sanghuangporus weigelae]